MNKKVKIILTVLFAVLLFELTIIYFYLSFIYKALPKVFPTMYISYTKDTKIMHVYVEGKSGRTDFEIPKAYFDFKIDELKDGKIEFISIAASYKEAMKPWSLSKDFGNKSSDDRITISVGARNKKSDALLTKSINDYNGYFEMLIKGFYKKPKNIYRGMFEKYEGNVIDKDGSSFDFFLIPIEQPEFPFFLVCPNIGSPKWRQCTVRGNFSNKLLYDFSIPFKKIEEVHEVNLKVRKLIESFIVK